MTLGSGCGGETVSRRETVVRWVEALNASDWSRACELMKDATTSCAREQRDTFVDTRASIGRHPFTLAKDGRSNDNKLTFAVTAFKADGSSVAVLLDVPKTAGAFKVRPIMTVLPPVG